MKIGIAAALMCAVGMAQAQQSFWKEDFTSGKLPSG